MSKPKVKDDEVMTFGADDPVDPMDPITGTDEAEAPVLSTADMVDPPITRMFQVTLEHNPIPLVVQVTGDSTTEWRLEACKAFNKCKGILNTSAKYEVTDYDGESPPVNLA